MNPLKYAQMMKYLTRAKKEKPDLPDVFPASKAPIPAKTQNVQEMEAINRFMRVNPRTEKAGGGMLVQPSADGSRPGYASSKVKTKKFKYPFSNQHGTFYSDKPVNMARRSSDNYTIKPPTEKQLEITEKVFSKKYNKKGIDLWESLEQFERSNIRQGKTTGEIKGLGVLKENQITKDDFIKLVNANKDKTQDEFVEILKDYRTKDNKPFTKNIIADRLRQYNLSGSFKRPPALGRSEASKEKQREASKKRYYEMRKTEEGRAKIKEQKQKAKAKEYQLKGIDPPATKADEAIFKDAVATAKNNVDGNGRFSIVSGYEKSMKSKDFFSNKIKIKDNRTGKTFTYNNFKNYVNKNSKSFGIQNYSEAVKPYRQKFFINDTPNLRNNINSVLIPDWTGGDPRTAFTIQHDFGRQNNPLKTSLAFFDDNTKEYKIRSDFEKSWEKSKTSETPLADKKKAFNVFKEDIAKLNIQSSPSMIARERFFGKELDLTKAIRMAKDQGAKIPQGTFKKAAEFDKQIIETIASFGNDTCAVEFGKGNKDGGRIGYQVGTTGLKKCFEQGAKNFNEGKFKTADQVQDAAKLLSGGKNVLRAITKYGVIPELAYVGLEAAGRTLLGEKPTNALLKSIDTLTFGATDFTSGIEADKFGKFSNQKLAVDKFRNSQALVDSLQNKLTNLKAITDQGGEGYVGDLSSDIQMTQTQLQAAEQELQKNTVSSDLVQFIDKRGQEIADTQMAKSNFANQSLKDQMEGIPGIRDYTDTESTRIFPKQPSQTDLNLNLFPSFSNAGYFMNLNTSDAINLAQAYRAQGENVSAKDVLAYRDSLKNAPLSELAKTFGDEQIYGTQGAEVLQPLAGGGIAKLAGVDQGPPPKSGPNSQGLQGLMKRVRNY